MSDRLNVATKTSFEDLSSELLISIFDRLTSIEILISFFHLNKRFRLLICYYLRADYRLTQFDLNDTNYETYEVFCKDILPSFTSTMTSFRLGSDYYYGQPDSFRQYRLTRLDSLTICLIDPKNIIEILYNFLSYSRLQWFDQIHLILDEEIVGWDKQLPFCVQRIPVRELHITGKIPYVFAQHLMTGCYPITHLTIHLKFDHDLLPLLYYLPNLIEFNAHVDDRGRDITNDLTLLEPLSALRCFKYEGLLPSSHLHRLILNVNVHLESLFIYTQDYQWPFHSSEGFSSEFFGHLHHLQTFHFYVRLITADGLNDLPVHITDTQYLIKRKLCENIAYVLAKDVGQIFSLPFAFSHFEIFEKDFFDQIRYLLDERENSWQSLTHLTFHRNIYDPFLLKSIQEKFIHLSAIDYRVPHFSLIPQDNELQQYDIRLSSFSTSIVPSLSVFVLGRIKKLLIHDSVKHGCHVPQPLFLLTSNLLELEIDHFYLMQILSIVSQQTQSQISSTFARLRRLTVHQFDERLPDHFFSYFSHVKVFALKFFLLKMQVYRDKLSFLDDLLRCMSNLVSLKLEHIKKPHHYYAYLDMQKNVEEKIFQYHPKDTSWYRWYDDQTQKHRKYATFLFSR